MLGSSDTVNKTDSHPCPRGVHSLARRQTIPSQANESHNAGSDSAAKVEGTGREGGQPGRF